MIWVFFVIASDSSGFIDTLWTPPDTLKPAVVVETADTTKKDTIWIYEIPDIVALKGKNALDNTVAEVPVLLSPVYQYTTPEVFLSSPFFLLKKNNSVLLASHSCDPLQTGYYLNSHPLNDRFSGFVDLNAVPVSCPDSIAAFKNTGGNLLDIDLKSKVNRYERPFSVINFTTLGDNTIYNIDFTRALTNDMGLFFSGLYSNIFKSQDNLYHKLNAYCGNLYCNRYLPLRFDFLYSSSAYGTEEENSLFDVSFTADILHNKLCVYYSRFGISWADSAGDSPINDSKNFGLVTETVKKTGLCDLYLGLDGVLSAVTTDHEGTFNGRSGKVFTGIGKIWQRLVFGADNSTSCGDDGAIRFSPRLTAGYDLFDSTFVTACVSRGFRLPTIAETDAPIDTALYVPNPELKAATWWNKEIGLKKGNYSVALYNTDLNDYIVYVQDIDWGYLQPHNRGGWSLSGIEGTVGFSLGKFLDYKLAGNYLFSGEPAYYLPSRYLSSSLTLKHENERSMQAIVLQGQYIGERADLSNTVYPEVGVVSIVGMIRFITLTAVLKVENILDQDVPFTPVPRLNTSLSLRWEFWD
ncbi:MAG TPA: TonB-dependent receptor [bacterium]